jgi:hypothetical protein
MAGAHAPDAHARQNNKSSKTALAKMLIDAIMCVHKNKTNCTPKATPSIKHISATPARGCVHIPDPLHQRHCAKILLDRITTLYNTFEKNNSTNKFWMYEVMRFPNALDPKYTYTLNIQNGKHIAKPVLARNNPNEERYIFYVLRTIFQKHTTINNFDIEDIDRQAYAAYYRGLYPSRFMHRI